MPRFRKIVIPKIKKSFEERGVARTLIRCAAAPYYLLGEYKRTRSLLYSDPAGEFDGRFGVETRERVHLSDLDIKSPNWTYGVSYVPSNPRIFREALRRLDIRHEDFTFVDFGSGKGRVLLMASEFPFKKIIGVEFSDQLHLIALENIRKYSNHTQRRHQITPVLMDITAFPIPAGPLFCYFYNPCEEPIIARVAKNIQKSLQEEPREIYVLYTTPSYGHLFEALGLRKTIEFEGDYAVYTNAPLGSSRPSELPAGFPPSRE